MAGITKKIDIEITTIHNPKDIIKKDGMFCRKCKRYLK